MSDRMYERIELDEFVRNINNGEQLQEEDIVDSEGEFGYLPLSRCGHCALGKVTAVRLKDSQQRVAVKKAWFTDDLEKEKACQQIQLMKRLKSGSVVRLFCTWMFEDFLFVMMELCDTNLESLLPLKQQAFARTSGQPIGEAEYSVSWHIIKQLSQGLHYLHNQEPPILHKNIKPANVLVNYLAQDSHLKLSDFDMSKDHIAVHRPAASTVRFRAPEVRLDRRGNDSHYNLKADIYGLAFLALLILGFDIVVEGVDLLERDPARSISPAEWKKWFASDPGSIYNSTSINEVMKQIMSYLGDCLQQDHLTYPQRPESRQFLAEVDKWKIDDQGDVAEMESTDLVNFMQSLDSFNSVIY